MALVFYRLFLWIYSTGVFLVAPWNPKAKKWRQGRKGLFDRLRQALNEKTGPVIWMHCASLGEFEQGRPVLEIVRQHYPDHRILLTFFSPSGYEVRKNYGGADIVSYLPADSPLHAGKFLDLTQPRLVLWVKYEYWFFYLDAIRKRNVPVLLISGVFRADQPFFKWYGNLHRKMLGCFTHLFVQNQSSKRLLGTVGFSENATVSGDTRFDRVIEIAERFEPIPLIEKFCNGSEVVVAGSTWVEDEEELDHYANIHPEIKFIIAPHEMGEERMKEVETLFRKSIRFSKWKEMKESETTDANVLIIDNIGMLSRLYKYATITYVGGAFGDDGVHNVLEAAVYGKPVVFGPVYEKYAEAVVLVESGAGFSVGNALELEEVLDTLFRSHFEQTKACEAALAYVLAEKGATEKILQYIQAKRLLTSE